MKPCAFTCFLVVMSMILWTCTMCNGLPYQVPLVGGNVGGIGYYSTFQAFIDCVKQANMFGSYSSPWDAAATLNEDGWPIGKSGMMIFSSQPYGTANGTYYFEFYGKAKLGIAASNAVVLNQTYVNTTGLTYGYIYSPPQNSAQLMVLFNTADNTTVIRNFKVIRPGYTLKDAEDQIFTNYTLNHLKKFSTLRFMDWLQTNGNPIASWDERPLLSDPTWVTTKGVPYELILILANKIKRNIWINLPIRATDEYAYQLAQLIKSHNLDRSIHVYLEYSNEIWNFYFSDQYSYNLAEAIKEVNESKITFPLAYDGSNSMYTWAYRRVAYRAKNISDVFASVFGEEERNNLFRVIYASQVALPYAYNHGLNMINKCFGLPSKYFYGLAGAPYFGVSSKDTIMTNLTSSQILDGLTSSIYGNSRGILTLITRAKWFGLKPIAYEGGPDTHGVNNIDAKRNATYDPIMKDLTLKYLTIFFGLGGEEFVWYFVTPQTFKTKFGTWGLSEDMMSTTPKEQGVLEMIEKSRVSYNGSLLYTIPAIIPASNQAFNGIWYYPYYDPNSFSQGGHLFFNIMAPKTGLYEISVSSIVIRKNSTMGLYFNSQKLASVLSKSYNSTTPGLSDPIQVYIESGHKVFGIYAEYGYAYKIQSVNFTLIQSYDSNSNCSDYYYGDDCQLKSCFGIASDNSSVCNGHGVCSDYNVCDCNENYLGTKCQVNVCNEYQSTDSGVCSGNGKCVDYNTCSCSSGFYGNWCESSVPASSSSSSGSTSQGLVYNSTSIRVNHSNLISVSIEMIVFTIIIAILFQ